MFDRPRWWRRIVLAWLVTFVGGSIGIAAPVLFAPDYSGEGVAEGFNDPLLGAARKSAFEYALGVVGSMLQQSYSGQTIVVSAVFDPLGGTPTSAVLGSAGPTSLFSGFPNQPVPSRFYPSPLANHIAQFDGNGSTPEIGVTFNSDVDNATVLGGVNWYYGTNGAPGANVDLVTVAMHELGHGLGFIGFLQQSGAYQFGVASIFDHFTNTSATGGTKLPDMAPLGAADPGRAAEAVGDDLWWDGANATFQNGGSRVKLYAPATFSGGSSIYHLDETTLPNELLSPFYSGVDHTYSPIERGMLADIGWTLTAIPEPGAWRLGLLIAMATGGAVAMRRQ